MMGEENNVKVATENHDYSETISTERKPRNKERGPDRKPRDYPHHTMKNLRQFQNVPHDNFKSYMQENKGVDVGGKRFNWDGLAVAIWIVCAISAGGYGLWWLYNHYKNEKDNNTENRF